MKSSSARDAHQLVEDIAEARDLRKLRILRAQLTTVDLLLIDDLFLRKLPPRLATNSQTC